MLTIESAKLRRIALRLVVAGGLVAAAASQAWADDEPVVVTSDDGPHAVAIGLGVGAPTGLTVEFNSGWRHSFELAIGWNVFDDVGGYAHLVYKLGLVNLYRGPSVSVPLYIGIGGFVFDRDRGSRSDDLDLGIRAPIGVNFNLRAVPVQIFVEAALLATVVDGGDDNNNWAGIGGYAGFRIWI